MSAHGPPPVGGRGLFASVRGLFANGLALVQVRLALLSADAELAANRLLDAFVLALLAMLAFSVALLLGCALIVWSVEPAWRPWTLAGLVLASVAGGVAAMWAARRQIARVGAAFDASRDELARDVAALRGGPSPSSARMER